jgi:uncharacterized repeat protein (TIGR01451 family)
MKMAKFSKATIISFIALAALLAGGLVYSKASGSLNASGVVYGCYTGSFTWAASNDDGALTNTPSTSNSPSYSPIDPGDNGSGTEYKYPGNQSSNDPYAPENPGTTTLRYTKDVAQTPTPVIGCDTNGTNSKLTVTLNNVYPFYDPSIYFGLQNAQDSDGIIQSININAPSVLTVTLHNISVGQQICSGATVLGWVDVLVAKESTVQNSNYNFTITITLSPPNPNNPNASPNIKVTKKANPTSVCSPGNISYTYTITNSGNVALTNVTLADNKISSVNLPANTTLVPGASTTVTATYAVSQNMIDAGTSIINVATATGKMSTTSVTATATATVTINQKPCISVTKTASPTIYSAAANIITYTYVVTNTGNVTLNPVTLTDNKLGTITLPVSSLAPGASTTATFKYTITSNDIKAGCITNVATATGTPLTGSKVSDTDTATVTVANPSICVNKTASPTTYSAAGNVITYTYVVTNKGNVTLSPVTLTDNKLGTITLPVSSLAPGASTTATFKYTITSGDVSAGSITNLATAIGKTSTTSVTATATATVTMTPNAKISVTKTASPTTYSAAGNVITYTYVVTNIGNVTLSPVIWPAPNSCTTYNVSATGILTSGAGAR